MYKPSDPYVKEFITSNPGTGAAANADSTPVATANHNGTDDGSFTLTVTNIDAGRYKVTGTVPSGYAAGDVVNVSVAATCSTIAGKAVIDTFLVDTHRVSDVYTEIANGVKLSVGTGAGQVNVASGAVPATISAPVTVGTNNDKAGYLLALAGLDAITIETGLNARQALAIIAAESAGVLAGATGTTITFAGAGVSTIRITATVDTAGNRTAVAVSPPA